MREYAGLTREELAGLLGVVRLTERRWETGRRNPRPAMLARVAEVTGAPADGTAAWDVAA
jgi:transcriptional regulator with XRE-family HTH domain